MKTYSFLSFFWIFSVLGMESNNNNPSIKEKLKEAARLLQIGQQTKLSYDNQLRDKDKKKLLKQQSQRLHAKHKGYQGAEEALLKAATTYLQVYVEAHDLTIITYVHDALNAACEIEDWRLNKEKYGKQNWEKKVCLSMAKAYLSLYETQTDKKDLTFIQQAEQALLATQNTIKSWELKKDMQKTENEFLTVASHYLDIYEKQQAKDPVFLSLIHKAIDVVHDIENYREEKEGIKDFTVALTLDAINSRLRKVE